MTGHLSVGQQLFWQITMVNCHSLVAGPNLVFSKSANARRLWTTPATANESLTAQYYRTDADWQVARSARVPNWQQLVLRRLMAFSFCFEETHGLQNRRQTLFGVLTPVFGFSEKRKSTLNFVSQPQRKRKKKGKEKELPKEKNAHASICQHKNKRQKKKEKERNSGPAEDTTNTARGFDSRLWVFWKKKESPWLCRPITKN